MKNYLLLSKFFTFFFIRKVYNFIIYHILQSYDKKSNLLCVSWYKNRAVSSCTPHIFLRAPPHSYEKTKSSLLVLKILEISLT